MGEVLWEKFVNEGNLDLFYVGSIILIVFLDYFT